MANVSFYRGTAATHTGMTGDGVLSFNPVRGTIHLGNGTTADQFLNQIQVLNKSTVNGTLDTTTGTTTDGTSYGYRYTWTYDVKGIIVHVGDFGYSNTPNEDYGQCTYSIIVGVVDNEIHSTFEVRSGRAWSESSLPPNIIPKFKACFSYIPCALV